MFETGALPDGVDEVVDPRDAFVIGAGEAGQPQRGPLDRHGRVLVGDVDNRLPDLAGQGAGASDIGPVELKKR